MNFENIMYWEVGLVIVFLVVVAIFIIKYWRNKRDFKKSLDFVFLQILIPKKESKDDQEKDRDQTSEIRKVIGISDHFFQSLYGVYSNEIIDRLKGQYFFSLEYIATDNEIKFFMGCPKQIISLLSKQITSFYPEAVVEETVMPNLFREKTYQATKYIHTEKNFYYPIKTYLKFESADPVNNILNSLSNASDGDGTSAAVQIMIKPFKNGWQTKARKLSKKLSSGKTSWEIKWYNPISWLGAVFEFIFSGKDEDKQAGKDDEVKDSESQETVKNIEEKADKSAFETIIRVITSSPQKDTAEMNLNSIVNSFAQFSSPSLNSFSTTKWHHKSSLIRNFLFRTFRRVLHHNIKMIFSSEELASIFHFPHIKFNFIPSVKWQNYKITPAPQDVPKSGLYIGDNVFRGKSQKIFINREDRFRHFYVIGQTGTGKSSIFQTMIRQDFRENDGTCIIDPHGSLVEAVLPFIPKNRIDDVIIFDPSDLERPMGLNLLEAENEEEADMVALDAMNIMIKLFDEDTFGPRIQDYFRNGCLTLMSDPQGGCLTDMLRLFTDNMFQKSKVQHVKNPVVKAFWSKQMASTGQREQEEMIPYFAAKFGQFSTNGMMRNILGQTKSAFDFSKVMDEGKILLMNLSKGMTGEINSKLLGLIIVNKIQMAALRRQKKLTAGTKPRDFFLYIDEFQNYVTDSLESILSEARKYRLSLNIAHQYIGQIDTSNQKKGVNLKDAVFGNVGTMMCYKIGAQDSEYMAKEMSPVFTDQDLINIDNFKAVIKLSIEGKPSRPFSLNVQKPWIEKGDDELAEVVKQISRLTFGREKKFVEKEIFTRLGV